jgi:lipopolysaccharide biosynthesis regulator YciM
MAKNESPHDQMVLAAHSIANANAYLSSKLFKDQLFNKDIFKHTVRSIQKGFNALQAVGEQHNHGYIGDMLDCCKEKYHDCLQQKQPEVFLKEPMEMTDFKSADKNNLQSTEAGKETVTEAIASQFFNKKLGHYVARRPRRKSTKSAVIAHVHKAPFKK